MVAFFESVERDESCVRIERSIPSAYFDARVADVVLGLIDERLGLLFRLHVGADGGL